MTGRILYQYNAAAMTARTPGLMEIAGEGFIEVNYKDAERLGIENGERIRVRSRRGDHGNSQGGTQGFRRRDLDALPFPGFTGEQTDQCGTG